MISRREFLAASGAGLLGGCMAGVPERDSCMAKEDLDEVVRKSVLHLSEKDYGGAREYLGKHNVGKVTVTYEGGAKRSYPTFYESEIEFLYAMTFVPGNKLANIVNGNYQAAGHHLEKVLGKIISDPPKLETMQENLKPFFNIPDYPKYKEFCKAELKNKLGIFYVLVTLLEGDYPEAETAYRETNPWLKDEQKMNAFITFGVLGRRARKRKDTELSDFYDRLTAIIK